MKILVDEDLPTAIADLLREQGHKAEHVREVGLRGKADQAIFAAAQDRRAILLTADLDFANINRFPPGSHHGIVVLRFPDYFRREQILTLIRSFTTSADLDSLGGALVIVEPGAYRVRRP